MNPALPQVEAPTDLGKVMVLIQEYTGTLRDVCQRELDRRNNRAVALIVTSAFAVIAFAITFALTRTNENGVTLFAISVIVLFVLLAAYLGSRFRLYSQDADELASVVRRLVEVASQFSEHASKRIADKYEFNLRLREADAVLRQYDAIFKRKNPLGF